MTSQDFIQGIDITDLATVSGSELTQLISAGRLAEDKGITLVNSDTALNTPNVPNPDVVLESVTPTWWKRYFWLRRPFDLTGVAKLYWWNDLILTPDPIYLKWEALVDLESINATLASIAIDIDNLTSDVTVAGSNATLALTNAATALTNANTAITNASLALEQTNLNTQSIIDFESRIVTVETSVAGLTTSVAAITTKVARVPIGSFYIEESYTSGTAGPNSVAGTWVRRLFTTITYDNPAIVGNCILNSDSTITLSAGVWSIESNSPCGGGLAGVSIKHKAKLVNITGAADLLFGTSETTDTTIAMWKSRICGTFILLVPSVVEIDHKANISATNSFGIPSSLGPEIYGQLKLTYLGA